MLQKDEDGALERKSERGMGMELQIMLGLVLVTGFCVLAWLMAPQV
jgi:hypothetical protein